MTEVMEPELVQAGGVTGSLDPSAQCGGVESSAEPVDEDEVVGRREVLSIRETTERGRSQFPRSEERGEVQEHRY
jgi:hypothetical protein